MAMVTISNLGKAFGAFDVFSQLNAGIPKRARIALVGPNGIGKTTLLNLIIGLDTPTHGHVHRAKELRMGFLPQRPELAGGHTLWEEMVRVFAPLRKMEAQLADLERQMAAPDTDEDLLNRYGKLQERYDLAGGFEYEHRMRMVLGGLGFDESEYDRPLPKLSGGQRTRALLGRLLLEAPDLLVMDEPTNHLDISAVEWLEGFLRSFPGAVLMVSHDRYFMDRTTSVIWEMDWGRLEVYNGNYSHYLTQRDERHERLMKEYETQQEYIEKEMAYIRKHMGRQRTAMARGKLRRLETLILGKAKGQMNRLEQALRGDMSVSSGRMDGPGGGGLIDRPRTRHQIHMQLVSALRSGDKVLMTRNLSIGYADGDVLLTAPDITLYRGEIAAVIGPNGVGKTTLLKTLLGTLEPKGGSSRLGAGVQIGYFAQAHEELNPENAILDELLTVKQMLVPDARNYLAKFLFRGDDVFRPISTLSGGERGRLALAKLSLSGANFLLLDEPTNHLDIPSQEILETVLEEYNGTILMVSHDRYLIDSLATQIWALSPGELVVFEGSYEAYVAVRDGKPLPESGADERADIRGMNQAQQDRPAKNGKRNGKGKKSNLSLHKRKQRIGLLEDLIHDLEIRLSDLSGELGAASASGDVDYVRELGEDYAQTEKELESALAEWEDLLAEG